MGAPCPLSPTALRTARSEGPQLAPCVYVDRWPYQNPAGSDYRGNWEGGGGPAQGRTAQKWQSHGIAVGIQTHMG